MKSKRILSLTLIMAMLSANVVFADQVISSKKNYTQSTFNVNSVTGEVTYIPLTVEDATTKAIAYSPTLKTLSENKVEADNSNDALTFSFEYTNNDSTNSANQQMAYNIRKLQNSLKSLDLNTQVAKDGIALNVKSLFNSIKAAQDQIDLYEQNMEIQKKNIQIAEIKMNLGLLSQLEYDNTVSTYNITEANKTNLEIEVNNSFRSLNELMGTDLNNKYDIVLDDVVYEPIGDINITNEITRAVASSVNIKTKKDELELAKYDYKTYVPTSSDIGMSDTKRNAVSQAQRDISDAETSLRQNMTTLYNNIISNEQKYTDTVSQLNVLKSQYTVIKTQYDSGKATELDVMNVEYNIAKLEAGLDQLVRGHALQIEQLNNPDLIK